MIADAHSALRAEIVGLFSPAVAEIRSSSQRCWSSVTFNGSRHRYALCISGEAANDLVDRISAAMTSREFALDGHVVADIAIAGRRSRGPQMVEIEFEALTVEAN